MDSKTAADLAILASRQPEQMTHAKGGIYNIKGPCKVQIDGQWRDGIMYSPQNEPEQLYVRDVNDCAKMEPYGS